jgi:hypothetical protein
MTVVGRATRLLGACVLGTLAVPSALVAQSWTLTGSLSFAHNGHTATLLSTGRVLAAGGRGAAFSELYDPTTGTWTASDRSPAIASTIRRRFCRPARR